MCVSSSVSGDWHVRLHGAEWWRAALWEGPDHQRAEQGGPWLVERRAERFRGPLPLQLCQTDHRHRPQPTMWVHTLLLKSSSHSHTQQFEYILHPSLSLAHTHSHTVTYSHTNMGHNEYCDYIPSSLLHTHWCGLLLCIDMTFLYPLTLFDTQFISTKTLGNLWNLIKWDSV